jgi:hypothetical protein
MLSRVSRSGQSGATGRVWSVCVGRAVVVSIGVGPHTRGLAGVAGCGSPSFRSPTVLISYGWALSWIIVQRDGDVEGPLPGAICRIMRSNRALSIHALSIHAPEPLAVVCSLSSSNFQRAHRFLSKLLHPIGVDAIHPQPIQLRCLDIISSRSISARSLREPRHRHVVTAASPASPTPASPTPDSPTPDNTGADSARFQAVARHSTDGALAAPASALRV